MNIIRTISQAIFGAISPSSVQTPAAGTAVIGINSVTKRLFSVDENGVVTTYGATGEYNDFVNGRILTYWQDFLNTSELNPLVVTLISAATITSVAGDASRRGIAQINKPAVANAGAALMTSTNAVVLGGGKYFEAWIRQDFFTDVTARIGFHTTTTVAAPSNGAYFEIYNGIASGKCTASGSTTSTGTLALTLGAWYKLKISVNASATSVTFEIRNESEEVLLNQSVSTNIPTAAVGFGFVATEPYTTARNGILLIDTMRVDL